MKFIDLSEPIFDGMPNCPVHPGVRLEIVVDHPSGWRLEKLTLATHTGTHIDSPLHKIDGGGNLDDFPLEAFAGEAYIVRLRGAEPNHPIGPEDLSAGLPDSIAGHIVLLNTGWGHRRALTDEWWYQSPYLSPAGASWLVQRGARGVGIDHYSIGGSRDPMNPETHTILLGNNVWVVEGLFFSAETDALSGTVQFMALPIKVQGASGAFCRAVLFEP